MGVAAILGHVIQTPRTNFRSPVPLRHNWLICQAVLEKKSLENGGQRTGGGPWLYYKLTNEPKDSSELKLTRHSVWIKVLPGIYSRMLVANITSKCFSMKPQKRLDYKIMRTSIKSSLYKILVP